LEEPDDFAERQVLRRHDLAIVPRQLGSGKLRRGEAPVHDTAQAPLDFSEQEERAELTSIFRESRGEDLGGLNSSGPGRLTRCAVSAGG